MSEIWLNLFSKLEEGLLKCLTLQKVMVNRKGTRMTVCFDAARLLDDQEFHKIKAALQEGFPGIALKLMVAYPDLAQRFTGDINGFVSFIDKILCEESPGVRPFLRDAQWELKDKRVILSIGSAAGVTFMQEKQIDRTIEKLLNTLFGLELSVKLEVRGQEQERIRAGRTRSAWPSWWPRPPRPPIRQSPGFPRNSWAGPSTIPPFPPRSSPRTRAG